MDAPGISHGIRLTFSGYVVYFFVLFVISFSEQSQIFPGRLVRKLPLSFALRPLLVLLLLLPCAASLSAETPYLPEQADPVLESWRWRAFPELKGRGLQCMAEDSQGNLWFGLDEGVWRYDGLNWTVCTTNGLDGLPVNTLCAAANGDLYAGTGTGLYRLETESWKFSPHRAISPGQSTIFKNLPMGVSGQVRSGGR